MPAFQPLTGPGWRVNKPGCTVEQISGEIQRRLSELASPVSKVPAPPIAPADRGRWSANWRIEDWSGVGPLKSLVEPIVVGVMREFEVEEPGG